MKREALVEHWRETASRDYVTMQHLFDSGDYHWCLFMAHLVIEKLLKACYVRHVGAQPPRIHDLLRLAELANIKPDSEQRHALDKLTTFNIAARYPDVKQRFYQTATKRFSATQMQVVERMCEWLHKILAK